MFHVCGGCTLVGENLNYSPPSQAPGIVLTIPLQWFFPQPEQFSPKHTHKSIQRLEGIPLQLSENLSHSVVPSFLVFFYANSSHVGFPELQNLSSLFIQAFFSLPWVTAWKPSQSVSCRNNSLHYSLFLSDHSPELPVDHV